MKKMLEDQNYRKNNGEIILKTFYSEFQELQSDQTSLTRLLLKTERPVFEKRLLNVFVFSGISEEKGKTLIINFLSTKILDDISSFYQELVSQI